MSDLPLLDAVPHPLLIANDPVQAEVSGKSVLRLAARGGTNLFRSPAGNYECADAPMVLFEPGTDFVLASRVSAELRAIYDAAALVIFENDRTWSKLCYENSDRARPTIVSVVTRDFSDDCNSAELSAPFTWLAIARKGPEVSFHYSEDGVDWLMVRYFRPGYSADARAGFGAHGSRGAGVLAVFSEIAYRGAAPANMRQISAADFRD